MSVKTAIRKLGRAFRAKDEASFDDALGELEEEIGKDEAADPETIEVHNHIPDSRDTALGEMPAHGAANDEEPPWFKQHRDAMTDACKKMADDIGALQKKFGNEDRRDRRDGEISEELNNPNEPEFDNAEEENLEMSDRRRNRDEPSEREEMAERIKERGGDRRQNSDEANREILGELEFEAPPGTGDRARKARDSRYLEESFQDTVSKAELLAPGIRLPTFDRATAPARTAKSIFALRRTALDLAYNQPATRSVIDGALSGRTFDAGRMKAGHARVLFNAVAGVVASDNNRRATDRSGGFEPQRQNGQTTGIQSLADINKKNREHYARS